MIPVLTIVPIIVAFAVDCLASPGACDPFPVLFHHCLYLAYRDRSSNILDTRLFHVSRFQLPVLESSISLGENGVQGTSPPTTTVDIMDMILMSVERMMGSTLDIEARETGDASLKAFEPRMVLTKSMFRE